MMLFCAHWPLQYGAKIEVFPRAGGQWLTSVIFLGVSFGAIPHSKQLPLSEL